MLGKAEEAERKAHASVHPAAAAITLRKGLGALRWSECLEFSECGGGGGVSWNRNKTLLQSFPKHSQIHHTHLQSGAPPNPVTCPAQGLTTLTPAPFLPSPDRGHPETQGTGSARGWGNP